VTIRKSGNGITYWSAENSWYPPTAARFQQRQAVLNITRATTTCCKAPGQTTDAITYDLSPLQGAVHVGDIVAVRLALSGGAWKYLMAQERFRLERSFWLKPVSKIEHKPGLWADFFTRKEFHDESRCLLQ